MTHYAYIRQHDATDCAAACLAMVCLYYRKETTITKLRDLMGTDLKGTSLLGLNKCAEMLGFTSQAVRVDKEGFFSEFTLPAIANIITPEGMLHFVVVYKVTAKYVLVGDPAKSLHRMDAQEFCQEFTGAMLLLIPNENFQTGKREGESLFKRYIKLLLPQKKLFFHGIFTTFLLTVLGILSSLFYHVIYDKILPYQQENVLNILMFAFGGVSLAQAGLGFLRQWIMLRLSIKIDLPLMLSYFEHIYRLPMKFFATRKTGDIITRFSDAFTVKEIFTDIALTLIMDVVMALVTGIILFQMNGNLFGVISLTIGASILLVFLFRRPYRRINEKQMHQSGVLNSQIIEGLQAVETIKGNASEDLELKNIRHEYMESLKISYKEGMLSNIQETIAQVITAVGNLFLIYFGLTQVIRGEITLGSMMAFTTLAGYFTAPVSSLVSLQLSIQEANISMRRLSEILDYEKEQEENHVQNCKKLGKIDGDLIFSDVTFRYGTRSPVLSHVSFQIPKGKKVALVGASGSGKSTIAKLLLKYYEPEDGSITIDGIDISQVSNDSLRKAISYVPQNVELFSKSIYDNIRISRQDAQLTEVEEAAKAAGAHEFISGLPLQYHTYLEEAGNGLSGGEKQRIAMARAFLKDSEFFIMDESTSNLDAATEKIIFDMIYRKFTNKTMLIIAHRLATIKNCDEIIVLDKGRIAEQGTHDELLLNRGKYYQLWEMQQGNF